MRSPEEGRPPLIEGVSMPDASAMQAVLAHRPELLSRYAEFYLHLWRNPLVPVRVMELCRVRIAQIHGASAELAVNHTAHALSERDKEALLNIELSSFTAEEQVALELAELMPFNHHGVSDLQVKRAAETFGEAGGVALLTALAFFDVTCRLKLVWRLPVEAALFDAQTLP